MRDPRTRPALPRTVRIAAWVLAAFLTSSACGPHTTPPPSSTTAGSGPILPAGAGLGTAGLVVIPAGSFPMGCDPASDLLCEPDETPVHEISLATFQIDRGEATRDGWRRCVEAGACTPPYAGPTAWEGDACVKRDEASSGRGGTAVSCITWTQAEAFCAWQGKRLPTEAEWEKAARKAGPRGLDAMGAGLGEWTASWYASDRYQALAPADPASGDYKVVRGFPINGTHPEQFDWRAANRFALAPRRLSHRIGVRCAR